MGRTFLVYYLKSWNWFKIEIVILVHEITCYLITSCWVLDITLHLYLFRNETLNLGWLEISK